MKKLKLMSIGLTVALTLGTMTGCGSKPAAETAITEAVTTTEQQSTSESATKEEGSEALQLENFASVEELQDVLGYMVLTLPEYWGGEITEINLAGEIASVGYDMPDSDKSILLSTSKGTQDITVALIDKEEKEVEGTKVMMGGVDGQDARGASWAASWSDGILSYAIDAIGLNEDEFNQLVEESVTGTNLFPGGVFPKDGGGEQVVNPMVEYETWDELEAAAGMKALFLMGATGYDVTETYLIDNKVIDVRHVHKDDPNITFSVRAAKGTDDISGIYGVTYEKKEIEGVSVEIGKSEDGKVAIWNDGTYTYSAYSEGDPKFEYFDSLLEFLVSQSKDLQK